ncbi:hypothetical protein H9L06_03925 [Leucobacter denitrificans]|uniref:Uncharacterized protein n=1 Tax=Leucobacter denitrificans TaxID=683042 RepID=A0A7G9S7Q1_9MICO|nr:hypothetical protein H9L06_03925 [Leucobacter denitrificans]
MQRAEEPSVLIIDGRSGSGKTTLAHAISRELVVATGSTPQIVGMDELYPGWDGLAVGSAWLPVALRAGRYRSYDWLEGEFGAEVTLDPGSHLIIEGCGSLTRDSLAAARTRGGAYGVWIECPDSVRKLRALARDGEMFAPHWERWADQERTHLASAQPFARAHEVLHVS